MQSPNASNLLIDVLYPASQLEEGGMWVFTSLMLLQPLGSYMAWTSRCFLEVLSLISWNRNVFLMTKATPPFLLLSFSWIMQ